MKKDRFLLGILAPALIFVLVLTGCPTDGGNGSELVEMLNGKASEMGITKEISVNDLISERNMEGVSSLSDFIREGGELYINDDKITSGSSMIRPDDTVRIMLPKEFLVPLFEGTASEEFGITGETSADDLFSLMKGVEGVSSLSDLVKAGCKLYVNDKEVTLGSAKIQPTDTVRIMVPVEFLASIEGDSDT
jgi:hypothetical protein